MRKIEDKIKNLEQIQGIVRVLKSKRRKIITTNGCFDLLHFGHVRFLEKARSLGDVLIVGINSDQSVRKNKGGSRPIIGAKERSRVVAAIESVDYVLIFNELDPSSWLSKVNPDIHVKGRDRNIQEIKERRCVINGGGKVLLLPLIRGVSTTKTIKRIKDLNKEYSF